MQGVRTKKCRSGKWLGNKARTIYALLIVTNAPDLATDPIEPLVAAWRAEIDGQISVSASQVQDHLLDLWGHLPEGESRSQVERWLTETLERHLYSVADIESRLERVLA
jgi:hypothetical protein